ncbi:MAG TPA: phosphoenolpyruvate carboxykinase (ATP) [Geobacteraceae bacterium]|nr:phosphoenolpyruvate carboxykinase (ATP) [Geobacteraceae bacterium]
MARDLAEHGIRTSGNIYWNLPTPRLYEMMIRNGEGVLAHGGPVVVNTAPHTGRSPHDKFVVDDAETHDTVWWGEVNQPLPPERFETLYRRLLSYLDDKDLYVQDCFAGASLRHRLPIRVITEHAWHSLFARSLFIGPPSGEVNSHKPEFTVIAVPSFHARPESDGTSSETFVVVNFSRKLILIGGTAYGGEIKKAVFTVMNYILPKGSETLSMHCSANVGPAEDVVIFFGLSGTGKTTLSADPNRFLIGDDEHGWDDDGVFNIEGGCYAKVIKLSRELEPEIHACTHSFGTVLENVVIDPVSRRIDLNDASLTENTRAAYAIRNIHNAVQSGTGGHPKNIFMLTCDAFGVLPPIARLTPEQAMFHFLSGYTAKLAGTEDDLGREPQATFSACFGAPFLPLHPSIYAELLRDRITHYGVQCWLVNTGWSGGGFGVGSRIRIDHTRAMIHAALDGTFDDIPFVREPFLLLEIPTGCPGVPAGILTPRNAWADTRRYDETAAGLVARFIENFRQFEDFVGEDVAGVLGLSK